MLYQLSYFRKNLRFLRVSRLRLGRKQAFFTRLARELRFSAIVKTARR